MESHGHTILIVDDDRELPLFLEYALTNNGFNVITAGNGAVALEHLRNLVIDLVVLDLNLPDMDGKTETQHGLIGALCFTYPTCLHNHYLF